MRVIELVEYIPKRGVALSMEDRDALMRSGLGIAVQPEPGEQDVYTLTPASMVGAWRLNEIVYELQPKVGVAPVLFMLAFAAGSSTWSSEVVPLSARPYFSEAVVDLFLVLAEEALRPGVLRGYTERDDTLTTIRGRVRMSTQVSRRAGLPLPIDVSYDDHSADILENRVLLSMINCLRRLRAGSVRAEHRLRRLAAPLEGVTAVDPSVAASIPEPPWTRLNERYRPAWRLGHLILSGGGVDLSVGSTEARGLVVNMNKVFEQFTRAALRRALGADERSFPSQSAAPVRHLAGGRSVRLEPDLTWWSSHVCVMVGDCKYKRPRGAIPNADVYQVVSYLAEYALQDGWLIYASGEVRDRDLEIPSLQKTIHVRTVDVAQDPSAVLRALGNLAHEIRAVAERSVLEQPA